LSADRVSELQPLHVCDLSDLTEHWFVTEGHKAIA